MENSPKISVIIVSFNDKKFINPCLKSLIETSSGLDLEIVIVDNNSEIPTSSLVAEIDYPHIKVIRNEVNEGFARAVNRGIENSSGDYYLLLNSDTIIYENCLANLLDFLDNNTDASCVGPRIHSPDGTIERSTHGFPSLIKELFHSLPFLKTLFPYHGIGRLITKIFKPGGQGSLGSYWNYDEVRVVDNITGACMMVRKSAVDEVGVMDKNFWIYTEEVDWNYRFKQADWKVCFTPDAEILHYFGQSTGQKPRAQKVNHVLVERYRGMLYFFNKHYGGLNTFFLRVLYLFCFFIRIGMALVKIPFYGFKNFGREIRVYCKIMGLTLFGPLTPSLPIKEI